MTCILTPLEARLQHNDTLRMLGGSLPLLFHWGRRLVKLWMERERSEGGGSAARRSAPNSAGAPTQRAGFPSGYDPRLLYEAACNQMAVVCVAVQQIVRVGGCGLLAAWSRTPSGRPYELMPWLSAVGEAMLLVLQPGDSLLIYRGANIVLLCTLLFQADKLPECCAALGAAPRAQRALIRLLLQHVLPPLGPALAELTAALASGRPPLHGPDEPALIVVRLLARALKYVVSSGLTDTSTSSNSPSVVEFLACMEATHGDQGVVRSAERAAAALPLVRPEGWELALFTGAHLGAAQLLALLSDIISGMVSEQAEAGDRKSVV